MKPTKFSIWEGAVRYYTSGKIGIGEKVLISLLLLGYIVLPCDLISDVFPVVGWLDDIGISCLALWYFNYRVDNGAVPEQKESQKSDPRLTDSAEITEAEIVEPEKPFFTSKKTK